MFRRSLTSVLCSRGGGSWAGLLHFLSMSFGYMALRFILMPVQLKVITNLLPKELYGSLVMVIITASFGATLVSLGHFEFLVRRLPGRPDAYQSAVLRLVWRFFGPLAAAVGVLGVAVLLLARPAKIELGPAELLIGAAYLVTLTYVLERIFFLLSRAEWMRVRGLQLLYSDTWFVPLLVVAAFRTIDLQTTLAVWFGWLVAAAVLARRWVAPKVVEPGPAPVRLAEVLRFGVPLMPLLAGELLFRLGDRYVLLGFCSVEAVANYNLCVSIAMIVYVVGASAIDLFVPEFNRERNLLPGRDLRELAGSATLPPLLTLMLRYSLIIALCGGLFLWLCGRQVLTLITAPEYWDAAFILPYLSGVPLFFLLWITLTKILLATDRTRLIGGVTITVAAVNLALNVVLVPRLGEIGSAVALTFSLAALALLTGLYVKIELWIVPKVLMPGRLAAMLAVNGGGVWLARCLLGSHPLACLLVAAAWCVVWLFVLGLVHWNDFSALVRKPEPEGDKDMTYEQIAQ